MTEAEIKDAVFSGLTLIAPEADFNDVPADANLREELDIDSYDFLSFLIGLNEQLGVEIPETDYEKLISLNDLLDYLSARIG